MGSKSKSDWDQAKRAEVSPWRRLVSIRLEPRADSSATGGLERAGEMKTYAKTLPGSIYVVDRRTDRDENGPPGQEPRRESDFSEPDVPVPFPTDGSSRRGGKGVIDQDVDDRRDASNARPAWGSEEATFNDGTLS